MITLTDRAVTKVKELLAEQNDPKLCLRVFITQGGCDGYSYGMTFDESQESEDQIFERGGVRVSLTRRARGCSRARRSTT